MTIKYYMRKIKDVKIESYLAIFPMIVGYLLHFFYLKEYQNTWAISERKTEARDNGYHFFKFMTQNHCDQPCVYVIDKNCKDYEKVRNLGSVVQYGSIRHWILYFTCSYLISSQTFMPDSYLCTFLERACIFKPNHVFLQHGITKDRAEFLLASHRRAKYFIAGAKPEADFMVKNFGYPEGTIQLTGFARFDALHTFKTRKNRILIMPTWRKWLKLKSEQHNDPVCDTAISEYISAWKKLLGNNQLKKMIDQYNLEVFFFMHPNMQGILDADAFSSGGIITAKPTEYDIQELMKSSEMIITDYSSVFFDMVYMKKPIIFYQFDEEKYRKYHYEQGWFDYHNTCFGKSYKSESEVLKELERLVQCGYKVSSGFLEEHKRVFSLYDQKNSQRIYDLIQG